MGDLFDQKFFQELPAMRFLGAASQSASMAGLRKSTAKGSSVEFSDFREYLPGDDVRRLDWNAYARLGRLYMKLYREEREGIFTLYLDLSASMDYGRQAKARQVLRMAAVLAHMALVGQDRVKICLCGVPQTQADQPQFPLHQSFHGSAAFQRVLQYLEQIEDWRGQRVEQYESTQSRGSKNSASGEAVRFHGDGLWETIRRYPPDMGGTSILLSDFMPEDVTEQVKYLKLYRRQTVLLLQVLAEEELHPDFAGTHALVDMEEGGQMRVTLTLGLMKSYQKELEGLQHRLGTLASRYQCHYQCVSSSESAVAFLQKGTGRHWQKR